MPTERDGHAAARLRALVIEDNDTIARLIRASLEQDSFVVEIAGTLDEARHRLAVESPDVVLLDVELPDGSGFQFLREPGGTGGVPVIILTGRDAEADRVLGLELGAEDYVIKPFFPRELAMRVRRAASRRIASERPALHFGDLVIDLSAREVTRRGETITLTRREFELLAHLASAPGRVFGRDQLLREVWRSSAEWQTSATVVEHVRRLRQKLEDDPVQPRWIVTAGRSGYRFQP